MLRCIAGLLFSQMTLVQWQSGCRCQAVLSERFCLLLALSPGSLVLEMEAYSDEAVS